VTSVGENEAKANTIQPPTPLLVFFSPSQFGNLAGTSKQWCTIMHPIWFSCTWKGRNNMISKNTKSTAHQLIDKIKLLSFWWLKAKYVSFVCCYHNWWLSPLICLGIARRDTFWLQYISFWFVRKN